MDNSWHGPDEVLTQRIDALQEFFNVAHAEDWDAVYTWDGHKVSGADYNMDDKVLHPVGLIATNAAASLAATDGPNARALVQKFWETPLRKGDRRYFDNFLYASSFLALSGNYKPFE